MPPHPRIDATFRCRVHQAHHLASRQKHQTSCNPPLSACEARIGEMSPQGMGKRTYFPTVCVCCQSCAQLRVFALRRLVSCPIFKSLWKTQAFVASHGGKYPLAVASGEKTITQIATLRRKDCNKHEHWQVKWLRNTTPRNRGYETD